MQQLSGLDATFLYLETPQMPMHVGALHVFELPAGFQGHFVTALRRHMAERLPLAPALRRKLWRMPLNLANPAWVDAEPDLRHHVVEVKLRKGSTMTDLEAAVGELHPSLLDRKRPLWKFHVFEGLAPGPNGLRRVGLYSKLHHAAVDGQAAVALANVLFDLSPQPRAIEIKASGRKKTFQLGMSEMLRDIIAGQAQKVVHILRELPSTVGTLKDAASSAVSASRLLGGKEGPSNLTLAPRTSVNVSVTEGRAFAAVTLPLQEVKALGKAHDATLNDMVLMLCSTALRRYFAKRRTLPRKSLVAAVPISLRQKGDTTSDNQASMSLVSLGTHLSDTGRRFAHIKQATAAMKETMGGLKSILPTDFPSLGVPWILEAATALYSRARLADRIPQVANVVISNVPGPPVPLFLAGARMLTNYPTSIIVHGMALNITVQSYNDSLDFGLMADAAAMPDVRELADAIEIAFDDIKALPRPGDADHVEAPEPLVTRARRRITGAMGEVTKRMMDSAVEAAVATVTRRPGAAVKKAAAKRGTPGRR